MLDTSRVFAHESQADLHALRSIGCSDRIVYVVPTDGGFRLSESEHGAVTRWSRWGCRNLKAIAPLVEVRY
jgi:hypothetical protein